MKIRYNINESRVNKIIRNTLLREGLFDGIKKTFAGLDKPSNVRVSERDFNCDKVAHCILDYDGMDTQPDYIGLGAGDYAECDLADVADNMQDFQDMMNPRNGRGFYIKEVLGIEDAED